MLHSGLTGYLMDAFIFSVITMNEFTLARSVLALGPMRRGHSQNFTQFKPMQQSFQLPQGQDVVITTKARAHQVYRGPDHVAIGNVTYRRFKPSVKLHQKGLVMLISKRWNTSLLLGQRFPAPVPKRCKPSSWTKRIQDPHKTPKSTVVMTMDGPMAVRGRIGCGLEVTEEATTVRYRVEHRCGAGVKPVL